MKLKLIKKKELKVNFYYYKNHKKIMTIIYFKIMS